MTALPSNGGALAIRRGAEESSLSPSSFMPALSVKQAIDRRNVLVGFVQSVMVDGVDFGAIPGTDKPTLLKPGAEKLNSLFGLTPRPQILERTEDWTGDQHGGEPFFFYLYRYGLYRGDALVAEADGSCNSWEKKYRWRWMPEGELPAGTDKGRLRFRPSTIREPKFAIEKRETGGKYGKPESYWDKWQQAIDDGTAVSVQWETSAGKKMSGWQMDASVYRVPNDDPADVVNTIQKMAQKRALIAATLLAVNASEFFTQDMEDQFIGEEITANGAKPVQSRPAAPRADIVNPDTGEVVGDLMNDQDFRAEVMRLCSLRRIELDDVGAGLAALEKKTQPLERWSAADRRKMLDGINSGSADKWKGMSAKVGQPANAERPPPSGFIKDDEPGNEATENGDEGTEPTEAEKQEIVIAEGLGQPWPGWGEFIVRMHRHTFPNVTEEQAQRALVNCVIGAKAKNNEDSVAPKVRRAWYDSAVNGEGRFAYARAKE